MIARVTSHMRGEGVKARSLRAALMAVSNVVGNNGLRLISNLILTRLLFPEAFGLMALVQVFIYGLQMFSDLGLNASIVQSKHGDDPRFLHTAWTLQVARGLLLWIIALGLAVPAAAIYDEPQLRQLLPVVALSVVIGGFQPSRVMLASRHLKLERLTIIDLSAQLFAITLMLIAAWWWRSVWALAFGAVMTATLRTTFQALFLDGDKDRFRVDRAAAREILGFGAFIFFSTIATFAVTMGGRAILGAYIATDLLGIFSIGFMLAALPDLATTQIARRVLFPLYRIKPPIESAENQKSLFRAHRMVAGLAIAMTIILAFVGVWLVDVLYDTRYALAGPIVVLISFASVPAYAVIGSQNVLLASGDSRRYFFLQSAMAVAIIAFTYVGVTRLGVVGVLLAPALANLLIYPFRAALTARYKAWDPLGELGLMALGFAATGLAVWLHWEAIIALL